MRTQGETSDASFRRLMERLFLRHQHGPEPMVFPGELPPEWDIPLPQGAVIVGSIVPVEFQAEVVLDIPGEMEESVALVERTLTASGWRSMQGMTGWAPMRGGFVPAGAAPRAGRLLCDDQRRRNLRVIARPGGDGLADVHLHLNSDPDNFVRVCEGDGWIHRDSGPAFPAMIPPPGLSHRGGGGGGGGASSHAYTTLRGELPLEDIEAHYREQLTAAGWRFGQHAATGHWAWSTWEFSDQWGNDCTGLLTVTEPPGQSGVRHVTLLAMANRGGPGSSATMRLMGLG
jgi:hypothetical protein